MKKIFIITLVFAHGLGRTTISQANIGQATISQATMVVKTSTASADDYQAYLRSSAVFVSPTQAYLQRKELQLATNRLNDLYQEANTVLQSGELKMIRDSFKAIVDLAYKEDWTKSSRQLLVHSYLRLAQVESEEAKSDQWLRHALDFDEFTAPNAQLFPPPLMQRYQLLKKIQGHNTVTLNALAKDHSLLLINGREVQPRMGQKIQLPKARVRLTLLSDTWQPETRQIETEHVPQVVNKKRRFVQGSCEKPQWQSVNWYQQPIRAVFLGGCVAATNQTLPTRIEPIQLAPVTSYTPSASNTHTVPALSNAGRNQTPFYKKTWFWLTVAGVTATALLVYKSQQERESRSQPAPSSTYGF